jgi:hypothetical protein
MPTVGPSRVAWDFATGIAGIALRGSIKILVDGGEREIRYVDTLFESPSCRFDVAPPLPCLLFVPPTIARYCTLGRDAEALFSIDAPGSGSLVMTQPAPPQDKTFRMVRVRFESCRGLTGP